MRFYIHQEVSVPKIEIGAVSTSSLFQIGNTAEITALSNLYNTGRFTGPAPLTIFEQTSIIPPKEEAIAGPAVPTLS